MFNVKEGLTPMIHVSPCDLFGFTYCLLTVPVNVITRHVVRDERSVTKLTYKLLF